MRRTRRLLLLAIFTILGAVGTTYYIHRSVEERLAPRRPAALPLNIDAEGKDWVYTHHDGNRPVVEVRARKMRQVKEPSQFELEDVELRIFNKEGTTHDRVRSAFASFDTEGGTMFSDGEVEITMGVFPDGRTPEKPLIIRSSGVRVEAKTGRAETERPASFQFGQSQGRCIGAVYDPGWGDLRMLHSAELDWRPEEPGRPAMKVQAEELVYKESESMVYLSPWSRFTRGNLTLDAASSVVLLEKDTIKRVDAENARGTDRYPNRTIDFAAAHLILEFAPTGGMQKIVGERDATLVSTSSGATTTVAGQTMFFDFDVGASDSLLRSVLAMGNSRLESKPVERAGVPLPPTRVLRSEVVNLMMRPGGEHIETIETHQPGTLEFLPNRPGQRLRRIDGDRLWIYFEQDNRLNAFRAIKVATRTENPPLKDGKPAPPALTWSQDLLANFDPESGAMTKTEQWGDFRYEEGTRKAKADRGILDSPRNLLQLSGNARAWDEAGATAADDLFLDQKTGDSWAAGRVTSTRLPDDGQQASGMLSAKEPIHATAARMVSSGGNGNIVYEGSAALWQGANRLEAERIEIDRKARLLRANHRVFNQIIERSEPPPPGKPPGQSRPSPMVVRADELIYVDAESLAHYKGNVKLTRAGMDVDARELKAVFSRQDAKPSGTEAATTLQYASADGAVKIVSKTEDRTRVGSAEHAEYFVAEEKVLLSGGVPTLTDSLRGATTGRQLTYFARDDRLLVDGANSQPAVSRIIRR